MIIDKRKKYYLTIDTETCNDMDNPLVYDIGGCVHDVHGNIIEMFSFVIYDTFVLMKDLMESAYYSWKIPMYEEELEAGLRTMVQFSTARWHIAELCKKYGIAAIIAHNASFDYRSCNTTQRYLTKSKYRYFFPYGIPVWDTLRMAQDTICKQKTYIRFCQTNGYMRNKTTPRATAEILYRYISNDNDFVEAHTGLSDVLIEKEIFVRCKRQHKKMRVSPWGQKEIIIQRE